VNKVSLSPMHRTAKQDEAESLYNDRINGSGVIPGRAAY
jgi:hypothetical protein